MIIETSALEKAVFFRDNESNNEDLFLRISVNPGGCAGLKYELYFDSNRLETDLEIRNNLDNGKELLTLIDKMSYPYLEGAVLKYVDSLEKSGFIIDNPNAAGSCSCGDSFN